MPQAAGRRPASALALTGPFSVGLPLPPHPRREGGREGGNETQAAAPPPVYPHPAPPATAGDDPRARDASAGRPGPALAGPEDGRKEGGTHARKYPTPGWVGCVERRLACPHARSLARSRIDRSLARSRAARWLPGQADKSLCRGMTFNRSQRGSCSATYETLTQNQVVYE